LTSKEFSNVNRPAHPSGPVSEPTIKIQDGWHCLHLYYRICQATLNQLSAEQRQAGRQELLQLLDPTRPGAPIRLQTSVVSGHKADLAVLMMDHDPLVIDSIRQSIRASILGPALIPVYSFVSITEVSEYVPGLHSPPN
jgi:hydrogen peroxide-dependent heme synthase